MATHFRVYTEVALVIMGLQANSGWSGGQQKSMERGWMDRLGTYAPNGLNVAISDAGLTSFPLQIGRFVICGFCIVVSFQVASICNVRYRNIMNKVRKSTVDQATVERKKKKKKNIACYDTPVNIGLRVCVHTAFTGM